MISELDQFYLNQEEPNQSCFLALKDVILQIDNNITPEWKYKLPFFYYKKKMFCYFWKDKKTKEPYIGIVKGNLIDHPSLEQGDRKRMKILRINPNEDLPVDLIRTILKEAISLY